MITIDDINEELRKMDESLARTIASGNMKELCEYNVSLDRIKTWVFGASLGCRAEVLPVFSGHIHCDKKYEYLLQFIKA